MMDKTLTTCILFGDGWYVNRIINMKLEQTTGMTICFNALSGCMLAPSGHIWLGGFSIFLLVLFFFFFYNR